MTAIEGRMLTPEGKGRTPVLKHSDQPSLGDHRRGLVVEDADKSEPRCRSAQHHGDIVERQLPIDVNVEFPTPPLQFLCIEPAGRFPSKRQLRRRIL